MAAGAGPAGAAAAALTQRRRQGAAACAGRERFGEGSRGRRVWTLLFLRVAAGVAAVSTTTHWAAGSIPAPRQDVSMTDLSRAAP